MNAQGELPARSMTAFLGTACGNVMWAARQLEEDIERKRGQVKRHGEDDRTHL